jgi:integrase
MATIRKRGKRYHAQVRKTGHPSLTKSFRTKAEAQEWAKQQEVIIEQGGEIDRSSRTLRDAIQRFKDERPLDTYQKNVLTWWENELGDRPLSKLRKADIVEARKRLQNQRSHKGSTLAGGTVNRRVAALSAVLTACTDEWFYIEQNPARIPSLPERAPDIQPLTPGERELLLKACANTDQPALVPFVLCAMASGARAGELQGLRWRDVDLQKGVMRLYNTKNTDNRVAPIQGRALEALRDYQGDVAQIGSNFVFKNNTGTFPFNYRKSWAKAKAEAGLTLRFHDLRHDAASNLAMAGASLREIGEVLGHRSMQMVKRYSHFVDDHIAELGKRISERIDK